MPAPARAKNAQCSIAAWFAAAKCLAHHFALNDAVVNKSAIARLVDFDLLIDGDFRFQLQGGRRHHLYPDRLDGVLPGGGRARADAVGHLLRGDARFVPIR